MWKFLAATIHHINDAWILNYVGIHHKFEYTH